MEKVFVDNINFGDYKIYRSNGLLGLYDNNEKQIIPFLYSSFEYSQDCIHKYLIVVQDSKKGVFSLLEHFGCTPRLLIPTIYDRIVKMIVDSHNDALSGRDTYLFYCYRGSTIDIWDESGTMIYSDILDEIIFATESIRSVLFLGVKKFGKCGVVSSDLRQITIPCEFDEISEPIDGLDGKVFFKISKNGRWGVIERILVPPYYKQILQVQYEDISVTEKYIIVRNNGLYAIRNFEKALTKFEYDSVELLHDSCYTDIAYSPTFVALSKKQRYYLYQEPSLVEIPGRVKNIYSDKCIVYEKDGLLGITDHQGKVILKNLYASITLCSNEEVYFGDILEPSLFKLNRNGKYGMFSLESNKRIPCIYDSISSEDEYRSQYYAKLKRGFSIYSSSLSCIVPLGYEKYEKTEYECDMMIYTFYKVYLNGKVGMYSDSGQCVPCAYDFIQVVNLYGYYNLSWMRIQDVNMAFWFVVTYNEKKGLINMRGEVLIPCICDDINVSYDLVVCINGIYSSVILSKIDEVILNHSYDD